MIRNLLLLLVVITCLHTISYSQSAEVMGNCFYQSANNRIVIRLALRNPTGSSSGQLRLMGIRFGIQYNSQQVSYLGFQSYMYGLNDPAYLSFIGPDTNSPSLGIDPALGSSRIANISGGGTKTMTLGYINRSTTDCNNGFTLAAGTMGVLIDIYFQLVSRDPSYYHLNQPNYGFDDPQFIAQFLTKQNGGHTGDLTDAYKEIAIVAIRSGNESNPYQPFDASSCGSNVNVNPVTIGKDDINFITPINGILSGSASNMKVEKKADDVIINWEANNNDLVDHYEIERKQENGSFKTVGMIMSDNTQKEMQFEFKDKNVPKDVNLYYRIKIQGTDNSVLYSDIKMIRSGSAQGNAIIMYPNPATDIVNLKLTNTTGNFVYRIYSSDGRMVMTGNVNSSNPQINISQLKTGSYFVDIYQPQSGSRYYSQFKKQ